MTVQNFILLFIFISGSTRNLAQNFERLDIPVQSEGKILNLPFTGGLRSGQFSNIDFDGNGLQDLFVFDRNGDQVLPFVKTGPIGSLEYRYAPEYISIFPKMRNWSLLMDYNNDGVKDIFTSSSFYPACIEVWKGHKDNNGRLSFKLVKFDYGLHEILQIPVSGGYTNIYVSSIDLPGIADLDQDGDIDIVSFEPDGSYATMYQNVSKEENLGIDSLKFIRKDVCWGKFAENQFNDQITLSDDAFKCANGFVGGSNPGVRHSGSSLCIFDNDGDGDMDLLLGDLASSKLKRLFNGGNNTQALMTSVEIEFPVSDVKADIDIFLSAFYADADGDNIRDLIVTPNQVNNAENIQHVWLYKNTGTDSAPLFKLVKKEFLIDEMLFFNGGTHPAFADIDQDGLQDIILGTTGITGKMDAKTNRMIFLRNTGSTTSPSYSVEDKDYLRFSQFNEFTGRFAPTFGDLDDDGDDDLLVGDSQGMMYFLNNTAGLGEPMSFSLPLYPYMDIFVGQNAKPQIFDLDMDGLKDIIVGEKNNELDFFKNIGTKGFPLFNKEVSQLPNTARLGQVFTTNDFNTQNGAPVFFIQENEIWMLLGSEAADISAYNMIEGNIYNIFNLVYNKIGNINQGSKVTQALADIDGDGYYEMAVGNERGGLVFYNTIFRKDTMSSITEGVMNSESIFIFPNPTSNQIFVSAPSLFGPIILQDVQGHDLLELKNNEVADISQISPGMYFIKFISSKFVVSKKIIIL